MYSIRELRANLKAVLDEVEIGGEVEFERNGVVYTLNVKQPQITTASQLLDIDLEQTKKHIEQYAPKVENIVKEFKPAPPDPTKGYPCCNRMSPCKHWVWQTDTSEWLNTLTGLTREVS